ncbi:MAG: triose-phosphate isomerase [Actinomycetota bacterium]|nr:triose-phosphate isomerase [Actinomycetota bacterium]MEC9058889.1 triose-phosphate isomerase [Actinomycetota bacterium]
MTRIPLISGNWKMNLNHFEAIQLVQKLSYELRNHDYDAVEVSVHPPFTDLRSVQTVIDADRMLFHLGAQNCHAEDSGAFTGEVSPAMLEKMDVTFVIVGHSERRALFGETNEVVAAKAAAVAAHGMTPIVCVGETLEERESGDAQVIVEAQVRGSLSSLSGDQLAEVIVAYEPVWAIGTGVTASADDAQLMCAHIRSVIASVRKSAADRVRIQYGGSVNAANAAELMSMSDIDGALVGGASLEAASFARIVNFKDA